MRIETNLDPSSVRVAIFGMGVVGACFAEVLRQNFGSEPLCIDKDPAKGVSPEQSVAALGECQLAFICVPTPVATDDVSPDRAPFCYDLGAVIESMWALSASGFKGHAIIRSTITPNDYIFLQGLPRGFRLHTMPEFLTEANAQQDSFNPRMLIFGLEPAIHAEVCDARSLEADSPGFLPMAFVQMLYPELEMQTVDARIAMLTKMVVNSFLATKVSFFNEVYRVLPHALGQRLSDEEASGFWTQLRFLLSHDSRIGQSHLQVPGPDGKFGFGGKCFPKDVEAMLDMSVRAGATMLTLHGAKRTNAIVRR